MCENESGTTETPRDLRVPQVVTPESPPNVRLTFLAAVAHDLNVVGVELTLDFVEDGVGVVNGVVVDQRGGNVQVVGPEVNAFYDLATLATSLIPLAQFVDLETEENARRFYAEVMDDAVPPEE